MRIDQAIMRKVQFIEECRDEIEKDVDLNGFKIVEFPERRYIPIGTENEIFTGESFYFYPTIVFYGKDTKQFGALLTDDQVEDTTGAATSTIRQESILSATIEGLMSRFRRALTESDPMAVSINSTIQCWPLILLTSLLKRRMQII